MSSPSYSQISPYNVNLRKKSLTRSQSPRRRKTMSVIKKKMSFTPSPKKKIKKNKNWLTEDNVAAIGRSPNKIHFVESLLKRIDHNFDEDENTNRFSKIISNMYHNSTLFQLVVIIILSFIKISCCSLILFEKKWNKTTYYDYLNILVAILLCLFIYFFAIVIDPETFDAKLWYMAVLIVVLWNVIIFFCRIVTFILRKKITEKPLINIKLQYALFSVDILSSLFIVVLASISIISYI